MVDKKELDAALEAMAQAANAPMLGETLLVSAGLKNRLREHIAKIDAARGALDRAFRALQRLHLDLQDIWEEIRATDPRYATVPVIGYDPVDQEVKVDMDDDALCKMLAKALPHEMLDQAIQTGFPPGPIGRALRMAANLCKCESCQRRRGETEA